MRKLITGVSSGFISLLSFPAIAFAVHLPLNPLDPSGPRAVHAGDITPIGCPEGQFANLCLEGTQLSGLISSGLTFIFVLATIVALAWLIYGAFKWIVSGGDKTAVEEARNHITAAIVGLVILFLAYFILSMVLHFFTETSLQDLKLPTLTLPNR